MFGSTEDTRFGSVVDNLTIHAQSMPTGPAMASAHTPMVQTNPYATTPYGPPQYNTSQTTLQHQQSIKHQSYVSNSIHSAPDVDSTVVVSPNAEYPIDVVALHACKRAVQRLQVGVSMESCSLTYLTWQMSPTQTIQTNCLLLKATFCKSTISAVTGGRHAKWMDRLASCRPIT